MKNTHEDYVLWDTEKNTFVEHPSIIYHFTSIIELINDGFQLKQTESFVCVNELTKKDQMIIEECIKD